MPLAGVVLVIYTSIAAAFSVAVASVRLSTSYRQANPPLRHTTVADMLALVFLCLIWPVPIAIAIWVAVKGRGHA